METVWKSAGGFEKCWTGDQMNRLLIRVYYEFTLTNQNEPFNIVGERYKQSL